MTYRVLVTGSRDWPDHDIIRDALIQARRATNGPMTVIHGACPTGADAIADHEARALRHVGVTVERHPAQNHPTQDFGPWPGAGPRRNAYMVSLGADLCLAFIGPCTSPRCTRSDSHASHGATGCALLAEDAGIRVRRWVL